MCMEERGCAYNVLVGRPEGKNHLEDLGVNESKICLQEVGWGTDWIDLARDRDGLPDLVIVIINNTNKCGEVRTC